MPGAKPQSERVLGLLRQSGGFVSGQEICRRLGITRSAVWKQVQSLRRQGFAIQGVSSLGYRLEREPDTLAPLAGDRADAGGRRIGTRVVVKERTGSTNEDARRLAQQGAQEGTVVLAESQTHGRGRLGRRWESPAGANLYLSVILRPELPPADAALITLAAAVALCRAMRDLYALQPAIKWPNDLLLEGRKAAGILAEMEAEMERIRFVVLGIGVNLNMGREMFPAGLLYPATSVSLALGREVSRAAFARALLDALDEAYRGLLLEGAGPVLEAWMRFCAHTGRTVRVRTPGETLSGRFLGLDRTGAMILETAGGRPRTVHVGDVLGVR